MPDIDKIHFLTGQKANLASQPVVRGQVYFAVNGEDGQIVFDAPIDASTTRRIVMSNTSGLTDRAQHDGAGNEFISTYPFKFTTTSTGTSFAINALAFNNDAVSGSPITIPVADATHAGIITNAAQDITGLKTFKTGVTIDASSGFEYSGIETATANSSRPVWFAYDGHNGKPVVNSNFTYNPSTGILNVANVNGTSKYANFLNTDASPGDNVFTHAWFSYGINGDNEKKRAYDDSYKYNAGTHTLNVTQYRINNHGLISYDSNTESIVFSFV